MSIQFDIVSYQTIVIDIDSSHVALKTLDIKKFWLKHIEMSAQFDIVSYQTIVIDIDSSHVALKTLVI